jgi:SIR2-like domain
VLLIQAFRRGWVPAPDQGGNGVDSITRLEIVYAEDPRHQIPVLAMLASGQWPGELWENDDAGRTWVKTFRDGLNRPAEFFDPEDPSGPMPGFRAKVRTVLLAHRERLLQQRSGGEGAGGVDFFDSAREAMVTGRGVPVIGAGIYGDDPPGACALIKALRGDTELESPHSLATVAEYRERYMDDRGSFLERLNDLVATQASQTQPPAVLEMLLRVKAPALVVVVTYDQMLEQCLRAGDRRFAVVAHVVHSSEGENDGKIVVFRDGAKPTICLADEVKLASDEVVVYRPLGSPLLHDALDPDLAIDTVVITETDHLTFLGRLENQHTKIPTAFSRPLQTRPLVFLGYGLDVWHYRLAMQVFKVVGARRAPVIAVGKPASPMEELAWKRLGADLARSDPNDFARRTLKELQLA